MRETGNSVVPADARRVSGSWKVEPPEASAPAPGGGIFSPKEESAAARGTLVLSYTVTKKDDIPAGATLLAERGSAMDLWDSFQLQERLVIFLHDGTRLTLGEQTFRRAQP